MEILFERKNLYEPHPCGIEMITTERTRLPKGREEDHC